MSKREDYEKSVVGYDNGRMADGVEGMAMMPSGLLKNPPKEVLLNPFSTNVPRIYPLKTSEHLRFSVVFREYRSEILGENGLTKLPRKLYEDVSMFRY